MTLLHDRLSDLPSCDRHARAAIHERAAHILRPSGALAWLDDIADWVAGWQRTDVHASNGRLGLIFAADHGVAAATKVSAYPDRRDRGDVRRLPGGPVDDQRVRSDRGRDGRPRSTSGSGEPTGDIRSEAALSPERFDEIVATAFDAVDALDGDLLVLGEMGIGNTTAVGGDRSRTRRRRDRGVGRARHRYRRREPRPQAAGGAGVGPPHRRHHRPARDPPRGRRRRDRRDHRRHGRRPPPVDPGRARRLRGDSAVLPLNEIEPSILDHCTVGHCSAEPGHRKLLERLGKAPLLDLDMRLGEGSGAMAAVPLIAMACAGITDVADVRGVVRRVTADRLIPRIGACSLGAVQFLTRIPIRLPVGTRIVGRGRPVVPGGRRERSAQSVGARRRRVDGAGAADGCRSGRRRLRGAC